MKQILGRVLANLLAVTPWLLILAFPRLLLQQPPRSRGDRGKVARIVRERCYQLQRNEWRGLADEFMADHARAISSTGTHTLPSAPRRRRRAVALARVGAMGRAIGTLTAQPLAPDIPATEPALRALHPSIDEPLPPWLKAFVPTIPVLLPLSYVTAALRSASRLSSAGPAGQTFEYLGDLFLGGDGLTQFGELCSLIAPGCTPTSVAHFLAASTLIPLSKPHSGVRPIAIGECLYRVVARALLFKYRDQLRTFFTPDQFAVADCEALSLGSDCLAIFLTHGFFQLDVANALYTISRSSIFECLRTSPLSAFLPFVRSFCSFVGPLYYVPWSPRRVITLLSSTETRQGDPVSGALFAFGLHSALARFQSRVPAALIYSFAEDTTVHAPVELLPATFQAYIQEAAAVGLAVSITKCRLLAPPVALLLEDIFPEIARAPTCFRTLGVPTGRTEEVEAALEADFTEWSRGLDKLASLGDAHMALALIRQCRSARPRHLQRTLAPTPGVLEMYRRFDSRLRSVVAELIGGNISDP